MRPENAGASRSEVSHEVVSNLRRGPSRGVLERRRAHRTQGQDRGQNLRARTTCIF